jgi:hypothetical protein
MSIGKSFINGSDGGVINSVLMGFCSLYIIYRVPAKYICKVKWMYERMNLFYIYNKMWASTPLLVRWKWAWGKFILTMPSIFSSQEGNRSS